VLTAPLAGCAEAGAIGPAACEEYGLLQGPASARCSERGTAGPSAMAVSRAAQIAKARRGLLAVAEGSRTVICDYFSSLCVFSALLAPLLVPLGLPRERVSARPGFVSASLRGWSAKLDQDGGNDGRIPFGFSFLAGRAQGRRDAFARGGNREGTGLAG